MLQRDPNQRLSAQECLDHFILRTLRSDSIAMAEEHMRKTVQQSSASSSNSKVNEQQEQIHTHIDTEYVSSLAPEPFFDSSDSFDSGVSQHSPGVEEAVAWRDQGVNGSRTALPPQRSRSSNPQPIPYGLVWVGNSGNGPENKKEVEVEEPTVKQYQRSKADAIASSDGNGPENQQEVEVEESTAKQHQKSKASAIAKPRRNLQPDKLSMFSPSGLSVAGPHRTNSQHKRDGSSVSKRPAPSSVARHRRGSSTSESITETAAAHALMELKKRTR